MGIFDEGEKEICAVRHIFLFCLRIAAHEYTPALARSIDRQASLNKFRIVRFTNCNGGSA